MIHSIRANQASFHTIVLQPGFNLILADRTKESTKRDSRNGLGKTTLLSIIHFCLGAQARKDQGLLVSELSDWEFTLDLDVGPERYIVTRSVADSSTVRLAPVMDDESIGVEQRVIGIREWTDILAEQFFGLPVSSPERFRPTFRALISYLIRMGRDAYIRPFETHRQQPAWQTQIYNAFLLGLNWRHASEWQALKERQEAFVNLRKATDLGTIPDVVESMGELTAERVRLEARAQRAAHALETFQVLEEYRDVEQQANQLTNQLHELANRNVTDQRLIELYERRVYEEPEPSEEEILGAYAEAGVVFGDSIRRRLDEVRSFHEQVTGNRRRFLRQEVERLRSEIVRREREFEEVSSTRRGLMALLQGRTAVNEYIEMQGLHARLAAELAAINERIGNIRRIQQGEAGLQVEIDTLFQRALNDFNERTSQRESAAYLFSENSQQFYNAPGNLLIDLTKTGFRFDVEIPRSRSQGVGNMKIFLYDLVLAEIWSASEVEAGLLVHDSTIFDGVDERQRAAALTLAKDKADALGFQYICTLNSDALPIHDLPDSFDVPAVTRLRLTDETIDGCLLGLRFESHG